MSAANGKTRCGDVGPILVFYACNEVNEQERAQIEEHLAGCGQCSQQLTRERELWDAIAVARGDGGDAINADVLLEQCRSELSEKLDDLSAAPYSAQERWELFGWVRRWMALRPAWSGAMLVFFWRAARRRSDSLASGWTRSHFQCQSSTHECSGFAKAHR